MSRIDLSPPPMRRARPPARMTPTVSRSKVIVRCLLQPTRRGGAFDVIEDNALGARQRNESAPARPRNHCERRLARKLNAPARRTRSRNQNGYAHADCLDDHFRSKTAGRVEHLISCSE